LEGLKMLKSGFLTVKGEYEFYLERSASGNYIVIVEDYSGQQSRYSFTNEDAVRDFLKNWRRANK
jgi:hypothetical protein